MGAVSGPRERERQAAEPCPVQPWPRRGDAGRPRGTRTRSASGRIVQDTGVGICTDSPVDPDRDLRLIGVDDDLTGGEHGEFP